MAVEQVVAPLPPWDADAVFPDGPTSHRVLIAWLAVSDNYARWRATPRFARTQLVQRFMKENITPRGLPQRSPSDVRAKIEQIEKQMRSAVVHHLWRPNSARAELLQICKDYEALAPAMEAVIRADLAPTPAAGETSTGNTPPQKRKETEANTAAATKTSTNEKAAASKPAKKARPAGPPTPGLRAEAPSSGGGKKTTTQSQAVPRAAPVPMAVASIPRSSPNRVAAVVPMALAVAYSESTTRTPATPPTVRSQIPPSPPSRPDPVEPNHQYPGVTAHTVSVVSRDSPSVPGQSGHVEQPAPRVQPRSNASSDLTRAVDHCSRRDMDHASSVNQLAPYEPASGSPALVRQAHIDRIQFERRHHALREEQLTLDVVRHRIQVTKERVLARHELRSAGVPEHEIDRALPLT